ncbi:MULTISPECIES: hypothetical protein [unclassified Lacticaseibacillus]|uniref:hypothetical protein n=1 Tax=unclassified Lacticaseibacillus TaxID=2759744 RepID=UPI001943CE68|nr:MULTISPECIES: hypothetical protein [unclassified Lacticaseibacillus]
MAKFKVIVWGLGNVGRAAIRMIQSKESLQLVAAVDSDPAKVGQDAGEVFGFPKTGVQVTDDINGAVKLDADVVLAYVPLRRGEGNVYDPSIDDMMIPLTAGKNVITTIPLYYMQILDPKNYARLDQCAKDHHVSFLPTGLLPGAYASYLPTVLAGLMGRVDNILVQSGEDDQENTAAWVKVFNYGGDPTTFPSDMLKDIITRYYVGAVYEIGDRLGLKFDRVDSTHELFTAPEDLKFVNGIAKKGTISGHRFEMSGIINGQKKVTLRYVHKICDDKNPEPDITNLIHIEGLPSTLDARIDGLMPLDESFVTSTAPSINAIPQVVSAKAGVVYALDLPTIVPVR